MAAKVDVAKAFQTISEQLGILGFTPRDADGNDFANEGTDIRFKVGTAYSEVTVTVWEGSKQTATYRATDEAGVGNLLKMLNFEALV